MKKVYVFNNMFLKFLDFLETISIETHAEIFFVKTVLKTKNKEELIDYFEIYCLPFKNELKNCNEEFFLNHNIQNKFNELQFPTVDELDLLRTRIDKLENQ